MAPSWSRGLPRHLPVDTACRCARRWSVAASLSFENDGFPDRIKNRMQLVLQRSSRRTPMKKFAMALAICLVTAAPALLIWSTPAFATCKSDAVGSDGRKLAGAALKSHLTKCENDAKAACEADSKAKNLAGAALKSHMTKCVKDKVG